MLEQCLEGHFRTFEALGGMRREIEYFGDAMVNCILRGGKIMVAGNGGSAADAQHFAAELTGRFVRERHALPALALHTDTSALTAIGNDYGFEEIFARQIEALGRADDLFLGISTSGNSENILNAFQIAQDLNIACLGLTGRDGGAMYRSRIRTLIVPSQVTAHIQEAHIFLLHYFCARIDEAVCV